MKKIISLTVAIVCGATLQAQLTYPVVGTGQTKSYNNFEEIELPEPGDDFFGQNSNFPGNKPSYTDNGDGTITDNVTGLLWTKSYKVMGYEDAMKYAAEKGDGWHVPTIKEAYSLMLFCGADPSSRNMNNLPSGSRPFIDDNYFDFKHYANGNRSIDTQVLSSTVYQGITMHRDKAVFGVNIADGRVKGYPIIKGNQVKLFSVYLVKGYEYGINDFNDNNDGTISDKATSLMWSKADSGEGMNWEQALEYAQELNEINYLGYSDWRIPNAKELHTILDYCRSPQSTQSAAIDPVFDISSIRDERGKQDYPYFWTSTTHVNANRGGASAVYICFGEALGYIEGKKRKGRTGILLDVHGAGSQRADNKIGKAPDYTTAISPQGDVRRIENYVRVVRDITK